MAALAFIPNVGPTELIIVLVIALLIFGRRLPEVGRSLGRGIVEFRKGLHGIETDINEATHADAKRGPGNELPESGRAQHDSRPLGERTSSSAPAPSGERVSHGQPHPGAQS